jgi:hypothetical protein
MVLAAAVASIILASPFSASAAHRHMGHMHQMMMMVHGHMAPVFAMVNGKLVPIMVETESANGS